MPNQSLTVLVVAVMRCLQYVAIQRSHAYRAELMRNPPPAENIYGSSGNGSTAAYTAMSNTYRAPAEIKTI
jgi:hypothetical protein